MKSSNRKHGFTLMELLVVIVIIAVLATVGFTVGTRAIKSARSSVSVDNLRQNSIFINDIITAGVNDGLRGGGGFFPGYAGQIASPWRKFSIYELIGESAGFCSVEGSGYKWNVLPSETFLQDPLSEYRLCEGEKLSAINNDSFSANAGASGGYAWNAWIGGWTKTGTSASEGNLTRPGDLKFPSRTIAMAVQNKTFRTIYNGWAKQVPEGNYNNKAQCLMADWHVELFDNKYLADHLNKHFNPNGKDK